jgi:hypothetical protein
VPALNDLLSGFGIAFGDTILAGSFSMGAERTHFASGANLARFPANGTVHRFSFQVQSETPETPAPNEVLPAGMSSGQINSSLVVAQGLGENGTWPPRGGNLSGNLTGGAVQAGHSAVGAAKEVGEGEAVGTADAGVLGNDLNVSRAGVEEEKSVPESRGGATEKQEEEGGEKRPAFEEVPNERGGFDPLKNAELNEVEEEEERRRRGRRALKRKGSGLSRAGDIGPADAQGLRSQGGVSTRIREERGGEEGASVQGVTRTQRRRLAGAPNLMATAPVLGLSTAGEGRIAVYGDSNCLDSSHQVRGITF